MQVVLSRAVCALSMVACCSGSGSGSSTQGSSGSSPIGLGGLTETVAAIACWHETDQTPLRASRPPRAPLRSSRRGEALMSAAGGSFGERWCVVAEQKLGAVVAELCGWPFERTAAAEPGRRPRGARRPALPRRIESARGLSRSKAMEQGTSTSKYRLLLANGLLFGVFG